LKQIEPVPFVYEVIFNFMGRVSDAKERLMKAVTELIWKGSYGSTTIDLICEQAKVKKGSFYYFFDSKVDLAVAAIDEGWQKQKERMDSIFSPTVPPIERLLNYCQCSIELQAEMKKSCGRVLGCPLFALGSEISTQEEKLREKIKELLTAYCKYLETAIRDAAATGQIEAADACEKARMLMAYYEGLMTQARILNEIEVLKEMPRGTMVFLGVKEDVKAAA
jgi:TetR/AcrR family transcriptional repressor of nem operon